MNKINTPSISYRVVCDSPGKGGTQYRISYSEVNSQHEIVCEHTVQISIIELLSENSMFDTFLTVVDTDLARTTLSKWRKNRMNEIIE